MENDKKCDIRGVGEWNEPHRYYCCADKTYHYPIKDKDVYQDHKKFKRGPWNSQKLIDGHRYVPIHDKELDELDGTTPKHVETEVYDEKRTWGGYIK